MVSFGNFFFKYRDYLFPLVFIALAALVKPFAVPGEPICDHALDAIGLAVAIGGQALRAAMQAQPKGGKDELAGAKKVLDAAALTYFAAAGMAALQLVRLLVLRNDRR